MIGLQLVGRLEGLVQSDSGCDHQDGVGVGLKYDLGFADLENTDALI